MTYTDQVPEEVWAARYAWLTAAEEREAGAWRSIVFSAHGSALTYDLSTAFCAGAWISVIVLSHAAIDATLRDTEVGDYDSSSKKIFGGDLDLEWLRLLRNRLVHVSRNETDSPFPEHSFDQFLRLHDNLESDARRAVTLVFRLTYASPGT